MKTWGMAAILAAALAVGAAEAQKSISRMISDLGLSPADFQMMNAATDQLVVQGRPSVGRQVSWSNPDTQSKGVVKVRAVRDNCAHLQHFIYPGGTAQPREIRTRLCQDAGGNWLLAP